MRIGAENVGVGQHQQQQPERLGERLQPADGGHTVRHQRNHHQRADEVAPGRRNVESQLQGVGHDRRFEGEEDEGEGGVDQRGQRRADVAKAGTARQQVHVEAVARGVVADRQTGDEDDQAGDKDGPEGIDEAVIDQQRRTDSLEDQKGGGAESGVGDPQFRPLAKAPRREAQGIVLDGLVGDPGVVVAADLDDALDGVRGIRRKRRVGAGHDAARSRISAPGSAARPVRRFRCGRWQRPVRRLRRANPWPGVRCRDPPPRPCRCRS